MIYTCVHHLGGHGVDGNSVRWGVSSSSSYIPGTRYQVRTYIIHISYVQPGILNLVQYEQQRTVSSIFCCSFGHTTHTDCGSYGANRKVHHAGKPSLAGYEHIGGVLDFMTAFYGDFSRENGLSGGVTTSALRL